LTQGLSWAYPLTARDRAYSDLEILDAGGGNGYATIPFAQNGCEVVVADYSEAMVTDGQKLMSELGAGSRFYTFVFLNWRRK
jgi:2-polyprenyl-3-methyl-5-hydroxy-6-metoxy-1,4-benzoquinol methylase